MLYLPKIFLSNVLAKKIDNEKKIEIMNKHVLQFSYGSMVSSVHKRSLVVIGG